MSSVTLRVIFYTSPVTFQKCLKSVLKFCVQNLRHQIMDSYHLRHIEYNVVNNVKNSCICFIKGYALSFWLIWPVLNLQTGLWIIIVSQRLVKKKKHCPSFRPPLIRHLSSMMIALELVELLILTLFAGAGQSGKGIVLHSLCETSCPLKTVQCFEVIKILFNVYSLQVLEWEHRLCPLLL